MTKKRAANLLRHLKSQSLIQSVIIVATAVAAYIMMTWISVGVIKLDSTVLSSTIEIFGTLVLMILVLTLINTYTYRKRLKEMKILTDAISCVASGDFDYRIPIHEKEPMALVFEDFNKMTAELSSVQLLRNDFINSYSHEFKTPIASINGFADLLLEKDLSEPERRQYLEIIRDESERLSRLAQNTILLSQISSQSIVTDAETYNLGEQIRQCAIICSKSWMEKKQDFDGDFLDVSYTGNRELMQHLWINILGNAIKYTGVGGWIRVKMEEEKESISVHISDNGVGMSQETMEHLFIPYYQGDKSRATQGLGLGLSISKKIVELCGGEIWVESEPQKGTSFTVILPKNRKEK